VVPRQGPRDDIPAPYFRSTEEVPPMKLYLFAKGTCACAAFVLAALAGGTAQAADVVALSELRPPLLLAPPAPAAEAPAMQVAIDAETGALRAPTAAERLDLAALAQPAVGLRRVVGAAVTVGADGVGTVVVDSELYSLATVSVGADGALTFHCGDAGHTHTHPIAVAAPAAEDR
jgi:hypothetical protein